MLSVDIAMVQEANPATRTLIGLSRRAYKPPNHGCGVGFADLSEREKNIEWVGSFANGDVSALRLIDEDLLLIGVHSQRGNSATSEQYHDALTRCIEAIESLVSSKPTLIAGDFNFGWHIPSVRHVSQTLGKLRSMGFSDLQCDDGCYIDSEGQCRHRHEPTFTQDKRRWRTGEKRHRNDHVYGNKAVRKRVIAVAIDSEEAWDLSDHRPILIELISADQTL